MLPLRTTPPSIHVFILQTLAALETKACTTLPPLTLGHSQQHGCKLAVGGGRSPAGAQSAGAVA